MVAHRNHEPAKRVRPRPSSLVLDFLAQGRIRGRAREDLAEERFMESFNLQEWTRIGALNRLGEVGRVTPCAPFFALQETVVAAVGAQRTARPTFRFMEKPDLAAANLV